ncbi:GTP-binding protein Di-Ras2 [Candida viswanathii]|uniref:GTP-binding protein Di-Ras2 n=1 Tax=Candida viswanathii TaxID=5486 RepID=A0A367YFF0_9ASCO|nr:GTP-binding protein Di-Ras2 [Candida viswanathii]
MVLFRDGLQALTKSYDICLVGSDGVGKSTLIVHYVYDKYVPDLEDIDALYTKRVSTRDVRDNSQEISIFESDYNKDMYSDGQERHILNANTLVLVYSIASLRSFIELEDYYSGIVQLRGPYDIPPIALIGTKFDLESDSREVQYHEAFDFAKKINAVAFHECSAKESFAIKDAFEKIGDLAANIRLEIENRDRMNNLIDDEESGIPKSNALALFQTYDSLNSDIQLPIPQDEQEGRTAPTDNKQQQQQQQQTPPPPPPPRQQDSPECPLPRSSNSKLSSMSSTTKKIRNPMNSIRSRSMEREPSSPTRSREKHACCIIS